MSAMIGDAMTVPGVTPFSKWLGPPNLSTIALHQSHAFCQWFIVVMMSLARRWIGITNGCSAMRHVAGPKLALHQSSRLGAHHHASFFHALVGAGMAGLELAALKLLSP